MARVYLETSFFSACVSERSDAASVYRRDRSQEWWTTQRGAHELFISPEVVDELGNPAYAQRRRALIMTVGVTVLPVTEDVRGLGTILVREKAMPGPAEAGDAIHLASAIVHKIEYLVSWNVRHLANLNKMQHLMVLCRRLGYIPPTIVTPEALWMETEREPT